ncbi:hypothetical protein [Streptomyces rimosus]|uniref:hypothetical protein n=1 Tax=Streptomyces rimosus TaxID=1927 RepID=UPI0004C1ED4A|nr:hypothetical protein [Streptomyces rimosus]
MLSRDGSNTVVHTGTRRMKRAGGLGAAALALTLGGGILTAPSAAASTENFIQFKNDALYFVSTCFEWQGPDGVLKTDCYEAKAKGQTWKAYFPAEATKADVKVTFAGYTGGPPKTVTVDDVNKNHCYQLKGTWPNYADVLRVNC